MALLLAYSAVTPGTVSDAAGVCQIPRSVDKKSRPSRMWHMVLTMPVSVRVSAVLIYVQAAFLFLVVVGMAGIILEPPAGGGLAITATFFVLGYAVLLCIAASRLTRGGRHARRTALVMQLLPMASALYLISQGIWSGWAGATYCLLLSTLLVLAEAS